jgi:O-antigen/teichoic acid export membrane protein
LLYPVLPLFASKASDAEAKGLHDEVQRKLIILIIPALLAITFMAKPAVTLWLGSTLWPVVVGVVCIVNCFLFAQIFAPLYEYLLVKGHPEKPFLMQGTNVCVNIILFALCVPVFGYYGAVLAFSGAVLASTVLAVHYQRSVFKGKVVVTAEFLMKLLKLSLGLLAANVLCTWLISSDLPRMLLLVVVNGAATVLLFRLLNMVSHSDIEQYIGSNSRAGTVIERLLIRGTS